MKEDIKLYLSADDIFTYVEKLKGYTRKLLELICEYSNIVGHELTYKSQLFSYIPAINK